MICRERVQKFGLVVLGEPQEGLPAPAVGEGEIRHSGALFGGEISRVDDADGVVVAIG